MVLTLTIPTRSFSRTRVIGDTVQHHLLQIGLAVICFISVLFPSLCLPNQSLSEISPSLIPWEDRVVIFGRPTAPALLKSTALKSIRFSSRAA